MLAADVALGAAYVALACACAHIMGMPQDALEPVTVHKWSYTPKGQPFVPWGNVTAKDRVAYAAYQWMLPTVLHAHYDSRHYDVAYQLNLRVVALYIMLVPSYLFFALPRPAFKVSNFLGFFGFLHTLVLLALEAMQQSDVFSSIMCLVLVCVLFVG